VENRERHGRCDDQETHRWYGLSYASYLVLPRTLLQSMPGAWQAAFTAMLDDLAAAFAHVPQAAAYQVITGEEHEIGDLTGEMLRLLGIEAVEPPWTPGTGSGADPDDDESDSDDRCYTSTTLYNPEPAEGMSAGTRVLVPAPDPVPHYRRGRARVEPRLPPVDVTGAAAFAVHVRIQMTGGEAREWAEQLGAASAVAEDLRGYIATLLEGSPLLEHMLIDVTPAPLLRGLAAAGEEDGRG
jgi:hypothetical protein